jgi:hypothetical protein
MDNLGKYLTQLGKPVADVIDSFTSMERIRKVFFEVDNVASDIAKKFGQGRENVVAIKQSLTEAYQDVAKMGGTFADIGQIQKDIAGTLGRSVIMNSETIEEFYAMATVTESTYTEIAKSFKDVGYSLNQSAEQMQKVVNVARNLGVSVSQVSSTVLSNMDAINKYNFQGGVEGLAKMAAQATSLRINMKETLQFADKVFNPEGAIETAAALQRLGVTQAQLLDPLRLMNLAQNDPTELQNQIVEMTKGFVKLGESGNFEIMPGAKRRFQEIGKAMGMSYTELTKMALGSAELDEKMKKIKFPDVEQMASKETRQMIANLAEKGKDGEYRIKITDKEGKVEEKTISQLSPEDVEKLKLPPKDMKDIAKDQLSVLQDIKASINAMKDATGMAIAGTATGEQAMQAQRELYKSVSETFTKTFDVKTMRESFDKGLQGMFDGILAGNTLDGLNTAANEMSTLFSNMTKTFNTEAAKNWENLKNSENKVIKVIETLSGQLYKLGNESLDELNKKIKNILEGKEVEKTPEKTEIKGGTEKVGVTALEGGTKKVGVTPLEGGTKKVGITPLEGGTKKVGDFAFSPAPMQKVIFSDIPKLGTLQALPQDTIEIRGGTRTNQISNSESNEVVVNMSFNINIVSGNINKSDIENALRDSQLMSEVRKGLQSLNSPNGVIADTTRRKENAMNKIG